MASRNWRVPTIFNAIDFLKQLNSGWIYSVDDLSGFAAWITYNTPSSFTEITPIQSQDRAP
jgi:hypothetical protein